MSRTANFDQNRNFCLKVIQFLVKGAFVALYVARILIVGPITISVFVSELESFERLSPFFL